MDPNNPPRWFFDFAFFLVINMYMLNLILALLVDGLGKARDEHRIFMETLENECLVCGLTRPIINRYGPGFIVHLNKEHDLWEYIGLLFHLAQKEPLEFTGSEQYVIEQLEHHLYSFFPLSKTLSVQGADPKTQLQEVAVDLMNAIHSTQGLLSELGSRRRVAKGGSGGSFGSDDHDDDDHDHHMDDTEPKRHHRRTRVFMDDDGDSIFMRSKSRSSSAGLPPGVAKGGPRHHKGGHQPLLSNPAFARLTHQRSSWLICSAVWSSGRTTSIREPPRLQEVQQSRRQHHIDRDQR